MFADIPVKNDCFEKSKKLNMVDFHGNYWIVTLGRFRWFLLWPSMIMTCFYKHTQYCHEYEKRYRVCNVQLSTSISQHIVLIGSIADLESFWKSTPPDYINPPYVPDQQKTRLLFAWPSQYHPFFCRLNKKTPSRQTVLSRLFEARRFLLHTAPYRVELFFFSPGLPWQTFYLSISLQIFLLFWAHFFQGISVGLIRPRATAGRRLLSVGTKKPGETRALPGTSGHFRTLPYPARWDVKFCRHYVPEEEKITR
jgi:hypothetical protein